MFHVTNVNLPTISLDLCSVEYVASARIKCNMCTADCRSQIVVEWETIFFIACTESWLIVPSASESFTCARVVSDSMDKVYGY